MKPLRSRVGQCPVRIPFSGSVWLVLLVLVGACLGLEAASGRRYGRFGDATSSVHYPRDRSADFHHLVLKLWFDWDRKSVGGDVTFTLSPLGEPLRMVTLDSADLKILEVAEGETSLPFHLSGHRLVVDLGRKIPPGREVTFTVSYETQPRKGLFFVGPDRDHPGKPKQIWSQGEPEDSHWWFPCYDYPNDKATFETFLTVPSEMTAVSNGRLVEVLEGSPKGTRTFHYFQETPAVSYLISVAIGEFDVVRDEFDGIPLEYYVPPGTPRETTLRSYGQTPDMMRFFSERIGFRYPYAKYAQVTVADFIFGGMENISATTMTSEILHPARVEPEASSQGLVAHELAHQWWGDLVTCRDWSHAWLNEGFATYFEALYREHRNGPDEFQYRMLEQAESYFREDAERYRRPIVEKVYTDPMDLFDRHLYPKGSWTLHMLRGIVGEDLFWKSIRTYVNRHAGGTVTTEDLRKAFEEVTGKSLVWFFEEWFHHGGHPEFRVRQEWDPETGSVRLRVEQVQVVDELTPVFRMPVRVEFAGESWSRAFQVTISRADEEFRFSLPEPPRMTRFDAGHALLKTLEFQRSLEELSYQLANDPDVAGRVWAARQLGERRGDRQAVAALVKGLREDPFWAVRKEIASALGRQHIPESRDALVGAMKEPDSRVRSAVITALGEFRGESGSEKEIRSAFESETSDYVRAAAVKALAAGRVEGAFALVKRASTISSHREVIAQAAYEGMADLGDPRAVPILKSAARLGNPRRRREGAIRALGRLARGDRGEDVVGFLLHLLQDPSVFARSAAIKALGKTGDEKAIPPLRESARGEWDARLRRAARQAIAGIRKPAAGEADLEGLRKRIEQLEEDSRYLRDRLDGEKGSLGS